VGNAGRPFLLEADGLYGTRPQWRQQAPKLRHREGPPHGEAAWLATDCDREGQLIGQEILEHYKYRRPGSCRDVSLHRMPRPFTTFRATKPNSEYFFGSMRAVARRQADQIYKSILTRKPQP